jgi:hypothetical protein
MAFLNLRGHLGVFVSAHEIPFPGNFEVTQFESAAIERKDRCSPHLTGIPQDQVSATRSVETPPALCSVWTSEDNPRLVETVAGEQHVLF